VLPAGKSGHLELGFLRGKGKPCYILFPEDPERWDVMYNFAREVFFTKEKLRERLSANHLHETSVRNSMESRVLGQREQGRENSPDALGTVGSIRSGEEAVDGRQMYGVLIGGSGTGRLYD